MPVLIYLIAVSTALFVGILTAPNFIGPVEPPHNIRFGMPAGRVATTSAEMTARAREDAEAVSKAAASRNAKETLLHSASMNVGEVSMTSPAPRNTGKTAKRHRRFKNIESIHSRPSLAFYPAGCCGESLSTTWE
jgi:hypothetical protein